MHSPSTDGSSDFEHTNLEVRIVLGDDALNLLSDERFVLAWANLHRECTWATPFQGEAFVRTWYRIYKARYKPLIVYATNAQHGLAGLLLLAINVDSAQVAHVGTHHAEYHTWLAQLPVANSFILESLRVLREAKIAARLQFLFLAPGTPLDWLADADHIGIKCDLRWHRRGLLYVGNNSSIDASLRKSGNKSRVARLRRSGAVQIKQLTTLEELDAVIQTIAVQCDVRQGGVRGSLPFRSDPDKLALYRALQSKPDLLHSTILCAGDHVVASHIGFRGVRSLSLGLITHAPQFGEFSPGKLLLLFLARLIGDQKLEWLDLTPGGAYKDRYATNYDQVAVVEVFLNTRAYIAHRARRMAVTALRTIERRSGKDLVRIAEDVARRGKKGLLQPLNSIRVATALGRTWIRARKEFRYYEWEGERPFPQKSELGLRVNAIEDLLSYVPTPEVTMEKFLSTAVERLEHGQILFTAIGGGQLLHYSWLIPAAKEVGSDFGHKIPLRESRAVLWDDFTLPIARGRGYHQASLRARLRYVAEHELAPGSIIGVRADNKASRHNIEKIGFTYCGSGWVDVLFGRRRLWLNRTAASVLDVMCSGQ